MSSPLSSLKKISGRKALPTLPSSSTRASNVPFRSSPSDDELLHDVTSRILASPSSRMATNASSRLPATPTSRLGAAPSRSGDSGAPLVHPVTDMDLMQTMVSRISLLEKQVQFQAREIIEKDKRMRVLEEKTQILQKATDEKLSSPDYVQQLEKECLLLQQQVSEMEDFLADYGMVWVGSKSDPSSDVYNEDEEDSEDMWRPATSLAVDCKVDYNIILKNVEELNILAGDGRSKIQHTVDGARLVTPDPVQLILYANGIVLFDGPFRPFSEPTTQRVMGDLTDGYFPSELRNRYPDGIPFKVVDKRKTSFRPRGIQAFVGSGKVVGGTQKPSRLVHGGHHSTAPVVIAEDKRDDNTGGDVETEVPGIKLTMQQFLSHLPSSVIKCGRVVDIRSSLSESLQGNAAKPNTVTVVETDAIQEMKSRLSLSEDQRPPSGKNVATLRIKSSSGEQVFVLKMKFTDTIGDVRRYLSTQRSSDTGTNYELVTAFPNKTYSDEKQTLIEAGLVPNATLHMRPR